MASIFNDDFRDFVQSLNNHEVEYILVGGYAVILHGYRRVTGDMDIWVNRTKENYARLVKAFAQFGMSVFDMTESRFMDVLTSDVFTFGRPPVSIDILTSLKGASFEEAYPKAMRIIDDGLMIQFIHLSNLIEAKKASGRFKDLDDIEKLSAQGNDQTKD